MEFPDSDLIADSYVKLDDSTIFLNWPLKKNLKGLVSRVLVNLSETDFAKA
jgi:hypothetical protein